MLICQRNTDRQPNTDSQQDIDWTLAAQSYPNVEEAPSFISRSDKQLESMCLQHLPIHRIFKGNSYKCKPLFANTTKL